MAGNRKLARKVTVLLKAISLLLWILYFPTKNTLHDKNRTFFTRVFSCRFFSSRFSWPLKTFMTQRQKSCSCIGLIFSGKAMHFYGLISKLVILLSREEIHRSNQCSAALRQKAKKNLPREVYLLARCFMLNWSRRHAFMYAIKTWNLWVFFTVFRKFSRKNLQKIFHRKWRMGGVWDSNRNYNWLCSTQSIENFISSVAGKTIVHTPKKRTVLLFFFNSKNTEIFPKLLFWSDSWVTAPVFHNRFHV